MTAAFSKPPLGSHRRAGRTHFARPGPKPRLLHPLPHGYASAPARKAGDMAQRYQERMAQRQAALKEKLKLTAAQESAWTQFTAAMQPGERPPARLQGTGQSSPPPSALTACANCAPAHRPGRQAR